ncbi:hypothetical protein [Falsiroseomonas oryzae]|uniref:hypothetical protein n=1 Tax=Falsiroseomonas oryzae TaxID=2766473 RepID=UPI0022EAB052|nr:hypothetical protein [Roseomonas sp. MO-31]
MPQSRVLPLLLLLCGAPAAAETAAELPRLPEPAGLARFIQPPDTVAAPLVIMLPDALGEDGRSEPYVGSLLARGIASLVLGLGEDLDTPASAIEPAASPDAIGPALAWARANGFDPARIGLLGFGLGGRAALAGADAQPTVALYPGCHGLPATAAPAVLVVQGSDSAQGCDEHLAPAAIEIRMLQGAGHGWDAPGAIWPSPGPVLPDPAGPGRLRARADLDATLAAAEAVADWFEARLLAGQRSAAR